jgi:hypothetical protein
MVRVVYPSSNGLVISQIRAHLQNGSIRGLSPRLTGAAAMRPSIRPACNKTKTLTFICYSHK